jgi:hypothetical protein
VTVALLAVLDDDVQPAVKARTCASINSNSSVCFNGMLIYLFIIRELGFITERVSSQTEFKADQGQSS